MIADFFFRNPRILALTLCVIVTGGVASFLVIPRLEDPILGKRVGIVSTSLPGATAQQVESTVTKPLEERLRGVAGVKRIRSNSQPSISNVVVELADEVDDSAAIWSDVREQLSDVSGLPVTAARPTLDVVPLKAFAAIIAVLPKGKEGDEGELSAKQPTTQAVHHATLRRMGRGLRADLLAVRGTEDVRLFGVPVDEVVAEVRPETLYATGLSTAAIAQQVRKGLSPPPLGDIEMQGGSLPLGLQPRPAIKQVEEAAITFGTRGQQTPLSELASVSRREAEPIAEIAWIDRQRAVVLGVMVRDTQRVDRWANAMTEVVAEFRKEHAGEADVRVLFSQRDHIDSRMGQLAQNLGAGTLAVIIVVAILMGWRSMLVVATALPMSVLIVMGAMRWLSIPIHQMSVTGLIVALGLLIDNAIVIVEDVRARIFGGAEPRDALRQGVRHLAMPLCGSTVTTALAFLPIATLPGPPGEFVGSIAVNVILAIIASFALSMTVLPVLFAWLRVDTSRRGIASYGLSVGPLRRLYERTLRLAFQLPVLGVLLAVLLPAYGFYAATQLPEQFFPASDRTQLQIEVELGAHASTQATWEVVRQLEDEVATFSEVARQNWFIGGSAPTFFYNVVPRRRQTPFYAQAFIDLESTNNLDLAALVRRLQDRLDRRAATARVLVRQLEQGPPFDAPIELRVAGPNLNTLRQLGSELRSVLARTDHVVHTRSDVEETVPQMQFQITPQAARDARLNEPQIAGQVYAAVEGADVGAILEGAEEVRARVKLASSGSRSESSSADLDDLEDMGDLDDLSRTLPRMETLDPLAVIAALPLPASERRASLPASGQRGPPPAPPIATLQDVSQWRLAADVGSIVRVDGTRVNEVKAYIEAGVLPSRVLHDFRRRLQASSFVLPLGYELTFGGEAEQRSEAVDRLIANGVVLFALMLLTLVALFQSFRCAMVIAAVGGLSIGLGPLALHAFGMPFGFMAIVGTMGLVGVAINDSIVVLAAIRANADAAHGQVDALVEVVVGATRHIIATTLTTIAGFLPLVVDGGRFWPPLAATIAGGVGGATLLALYFVPSLYRIIFSFQPRGRRWEAVENR